MPPIRLPRVRVGRPSSTAMIAGLLVVCLGTAATAVTAELQEKGHPAAGSAQGQQPGLAGNGSSPAPVASSRPAGAVALSTRPKRLFPATLLVSRQTPLTHGDLRRIRHVTGVRRTRAVAAGRAKVDGRSAFVMGVDPQTFRPWTPKLTADSNRLWASVSAGELTASFDMGHGAKLPLGGTVPVAGQRETTPIRVGAFASVGMAGVDAVVSNARAHQIGLLARTGVLVSAPKADPIALRNAVLGIVGKHSRAEVLREVIVTRDAGEFLTRKQISGFLHAAASRVGAPYVWGATGPNSFDCSGLVQWSFARIGIAMPRVAQEQFFTGPHVPYRDARPGDLLFWHYDPTDPTFVDHVAIYVGNGQMIEAPHTGELVKLVPVPLAHLAGVVRVDPALAGKIA